MTITRIDEASLLRIGFDRPTVKALAQLLRMVGNSETTSEVTTLPQLVTLVDALSGAFDFVAVQPAIAAPAPADDLAPAVQPVQAMPDDLSPVAQLAERVEYLQAEVRQLAEQQAALMNQINELRQGTTP